MKRNFDRRTVAERFNQLPIPPAGAIPDPATLASIGISHLLNLGIQSVGGAATTVTMQNLRDHFLTKGSNPNYECKANAIVKELGAATIVESLTPPQLRSWFNRQPRNPSSRNHYLEYFATMLKAGLRDGIIRSNPLGGGIKQQLLIKITLTEAEILTVDEVRQVMNEALSRPDACHVLALMLFGGLDVSQAAGLCYEDVRSTIRVPGYLTNGPAWDLYCPPNLPAWLHSDGTKKGRITQMSGNSMGRVIKKIFQKLDIPRPADIGYTWSAHRRAVLGDITKVYEGRYATGTKIPESRVPVVPRAEGVRYFNIYPPAGATKPSTSIFSVLPPQNQDRA